MNENVKKGLVKKGLFVAIEKAGWNVPEQVYKNYLNIEYTTLHGYVFNRRINCETEDVRDDVFDIFKSFDIDTFIRLRLEDNEKNGYVGSYAQKIIDDAKEIEMALKNLCVSVCLFHQVYVVETEFPDIKKLIESYAYTEVDKDVKTVNIEELNIRL